MLLPVRALSVLGAPVGSRRTGAGTVRRKVYNNRISARLCLYRRLAPGRRCVLPDLAAQTAMLEDVSVLANPRSCRTSRTNRIDRLVLACLAGRICQTGSLD